MSNAYACEICGKDLRSRKAYVGHMLLAHQKRVGVMAEIDASIAEMSQTVREISRMDAELQELRHKILPQIIETLDGLTKTFQSCIESHDGEARGSGQVLPLENIRRSSGDETKETQHVKTQGGHNLPIVQGTLLD